MKRKANKPMPIARFGETEVAMNHCANIVALAQLVARLHPKETPDYVIQASGMIFDEAEKLREFLTKLLYH